MQEIEEMVFENYNKLECTMTKETLFPHFHELFVRGFTFLVSCKNSTIDSLLNECNACIKNQV